MSFIRIFKYKIIILYVFTLLILNSCSSYRPFVTYQLKSTFTLENNDYYATNQDIELLVNKYDGIIKSSSRMNMNEGIPSQSEYKILINIKNYSEFLNSFKFKFNLDIIEETNKQESFSELIVKERIERQKILEGRIRELILDLRSEKDDNLKEYLSLHIKNSIKELNETLNDISYDRENMKYSVIEVKWHSRIKEMRNDDYPKQKDSSIAGITPIHDITFNDFGQVASFSTGEAVAFRFNDTKYQNGSLTAKLDKNEGKINLEFSEITSETIIRLDTKCQKIDLGLGPIPKIIIAPEIDREQVILTPRVDDDCNIIGFELRAGTIESGCSEGKQNLIRLQNCIKYHKVTAPPPHKHKFRNSHKTKQINNKELFYYLPLE
jgi:hypothetical protein